jgi:hypothetical protein
MITQTLNRRQLLVLGAALAGTALSMPLAMVEAAGGRAGLPAAASLGPLINVPQTWNNCGPASISEILAYWGIQRSQAEIQPILRVDGPGAGMTPYGVPAYAASVGMRALMGVGGTGVLIKRLVAAGFPVMVHQVVSLSDTVGHYRPIEAYSDRLGIFTASDPYLGPGYQMSYALFNQLWAYRAGQFILLYPPSRQRALNAVLAAAGWNKTAAYTHDIALVRAGQEDVNPAGAAGGTAGFLALALAWDSVQLGRYSAARTYLLQAAAAGANPIEVAWIRALA